MGASPVQPNWNAAVVFSNGHIHPFTLNAIERQLLEHMFQNLLFHIFDARGWDDCYPTQQIAEGHIRCTAGIEKFERVFRFSRASLYWVCIEQVADIRFRYKLHNDSGIGSISWIS